MEPTAEPVTDLEILLRKMKPTLVDGEYVFCTLPGAAYGEGAELEPIASFVETEGLTLVVPRPNAAAAGLPYDGVFRLISLSVWSDLQAVGLTAAIATALADARISANVIAAYHHDHVFVPADRAEEALSLLQRLSVPDAGHRKGQRAT